MKTSLQKAAKNLIDRWASPFWKDQKGTAHFVKELEKALDLELQVPLQAFDIEADIVSAHYFTGSQGVHGTYSGFGEFPQIPQPLGLLTFCVLVMRDGVTVTGESTCVNRKNFDFENEKRIACANALQKIKVYFREQQTQDDYRPLSAGKRAEIIEELYAGYDTMEDSELERLDTLCKKAARLIEAEENENKVVPMSDDEILNLQYLCGGFNLIDFARAIEAHVLTKVKKLK